MRSAVLDLTWYQYFLLDVVAVLAVAVGSAVFLMFLMLRALLRKLLLCKRRQQQEPLPVLEKKLS
jgi:hypothetical protein